MKEEMAKEKKQRKLCSRIFLVGALVAAVANTMGQENHWGMFAITIIFLFLAAAIWPEEEKEKKFDTDQDTGFSGHGEP